MYGYIYKITNTIDNRIYIGKRKGDFDPNYWGSGVAIRSAIKKYGKNNFTIEVLCYCDTIEELNDKECYFIGMFNSTERGIGYNLAYGGDGGDTLALMEENNLRCRNSKLSSSLKGHYVSDETRKKLSEAQLRNWAQNKERRSKENSVVRKRPDVRKKISEGQKRVWKSKDRRIAASKKAKERYSNPEMAKKYRDAHSTEEYKKKMSSLLKGKTFGWKFYNNGVVETRAPDELGIELLKNGYSLGRLPLSEEAKKKISVTMRNRRKNP